MRSGAALRKRTKVGAFGVVALLGLAAAGCDVVQGFKHAGDALFPPVKTYLDAPGYQLVTGGYRQLVLLTSSELFVLARASKEGDDALYSIRYAVPTPCAIPHVGRYWAGGSLDVGQAWIAYFHDGSNRGTLTFADTGCNVAPLTLPDAELPYARVTPRGPDGKLETERLLLLIRSAGQLLLVDPASQDPPELLIEPADGLVSGVGKAHVNLVVSAGKLAVFDTDWNYLETFADNVTNLSQLGDAVYFEDANGIQRATTTTKNGVTTMDVKVLAADGCLLAFPSTARRWVGFFSPCADHTLMIYDESSEAPMPAPTPLGLTLDDPRTLVLVPDPTLTGPVSPMLDKVWAFFLRDTDYNAGLGTLVAHTPAGDELVLGANAALERTALDKSGDYGVALVDVSGDTGRYVRFQPDGSIDELGQNVLRDGTGQSFADAMIDWNGISGTLAQLDGGELYPLLDGVPRHNFAYQDVHRRQALFHDFDGENGTLSIGEPACSPGTTHCERQYYVPHVVARGVHHPDHAFFDETTDFLPGIGFLDQYDEDRGVGRFQYRNLELGFTSLVSEGVSDFTFAGNGMLYAVPFGEGAGIWLARAK